MSRHSFDPEIAAETSIAAAVIYQNIAFWCEKNEANGRHVHDGKAWSYNSITAFEKLFPYLTKSQIRTALEKLEEAGFIEVGVFNKDPRDKTKWYAISRTCICEKSQMELSKIADPFAKNRKPLPDIKPDINNTPKPPEGASDLFSAENETGSQAERADDGFERFWEVYPKKAAKKDAQKAWMKAVKRETPDRIVSAAKKYAAWLSAPCRPGEFKPHPKNAQGWLNGDRWQDFLDQPHSFRWDDLTQTQKNQLGTGHCPRSMMDENGQPNEVAAYWLARMRRAS